MPEKTRSNKAPDIGREFERSSAPNKALPDYSLGGTARAEIANVQNHEATLDKHDQKWLRERDRLSNSAMSIPEFNLGSKETCLVNMRKGAVSGITSKPPSTSILEI